MKSTGNAVNINVRWKWIFGGCLAVGLVVAVGCGRDVSSGTAWEFTAPLPDTGSDVDRDTGTDAEVCSADACTDGGDGTPSCQSGQSRTREGACGYKNRGTRVEVCQNGRWQRQGCRDVWFASCREINEARPGAGDGTYTIDPDGPSGSNFSSFQVACDMTTDGGGWTEITPCIALNELQGNLVGVERGLRDGIDDNCRPWSIDGRGAHTYHYTFQFPATFSEFILEDYHLKARAQGSRGGKQNTSDIHVWNQTRWRLGHSPQSRQAKWGSGDVSFGSASAAGPADSFARHVPAESCPGHGGQVPPQFCCVSCTLTWTWTRPIQLDAPADAFRIGWGERGPQQEGWYPWWSGTIKLR